MSNHPAPPPEAVLMRRARLAKGMSVEVAAQRVAELSGQRFSASRWSQLESGYRMSAGSPLPQSAQDGRLAQMAYVVGVSPSQLVEVHRGEAAEILKEMNRQRAELSDPLQEKIAEVRNSRVFTDEEKDDLIKALRAHRKPPPGPPRQESQAG